MRVVKLAKGKTAPPHNFTGIAEYPDGSKEWFLNGNRHRVDGPAWEGADGTKRWFLNGKYHRVDGPAIQRADGEKVWFCYGNIHREDGPAIEHVDGEKSWYLNDLWVYTLKVKNWIVIEEGLPSTMNWLGKPVSTLKVLTTNGIQFIPNLPGV